MLTVSMLISKKRWPLSFAACALSLILILRGLSLGAMPLIDPSESRYALVSRLMLSQHSIVMPQVISHGGAVEPFWAKPPLFFWLNAICLKLFGMNEGAARLPSFFAMLFAISAIFVAAQKLISTRAAWTSALLLTTSGVFFVYGGLCQVDMLLAAAVAWAYCGLALWSNDERRRPLWLFVIAFALAVGFLTKGPVAIALCLAGFLPWAYSVRNMPAGKSFARFPHFKFLLLFTLIALPWFLIAEKQNPGFLRYFFVNENLLRYLTPHYGDLYGSAHRYPFGTIWLFGAVATLPWGPLLLLRGYRKTFAHCWSDPWQRFAFFWALSPLLLFSLGQNILPSYVLPGIPGFALLAAMEFHRFENRDLRKIFISWAPAFGATILGLAVVAIMALLLHLPKDQSAAPYHLLTQTNLALFFLATLAFCMQTKYLRRYTREVLAVETGCMLFIMQAVAGAITAPSVPSATYALYIGHRFPSKNYEINFPFGIPYSAYLYLSHNLECDPAEISSGEDSKFHEAVFVPKSKASQFERLAIDSNDAFQLVADWGEWSVFERLSSIIARRS